MGVMVDFVLSEETWASPIALRLVIISGFYPAELRKRGLYCSVQTPDNGIVLVVEVLKNMHRQAITLPGTVEKIITPTTPGDAEKVEISIQSGDDPGQRIRIPNTLSNAQGEAVALKSGAAVRFVISPKAKDVN